MVDNINYVNRGYTYNTLTGKWQRVTTVNDFQQIAGRVGSAGTTELVIASGTPTSNKDLYVTTVTFSNQSGTAAAFAISNANSTINYQYVASGAQVQLIGAAKDPLFKVANGDTLGMVVINPVANGTYTASVTANRVTIDGKIEP